MQVINLHPHFNPYGKGLDFESFTFHGGEPHFKMIDPIDTKESLIITAKVRKMEDFMALVVALDAIKRLYYIHNHKGKISLLLPYFPGARQDRVCNPGEPFTLEVFARIINHYELKEVIIFDPHSPITIESVNNSKAIDATAFVKKCVESLPENLALVAPDKGAKNRVRSIAKSIDIKIVIQGVKKRNLETGRIEKLIIECEDLQGQDCLVVDDICDGGATFLRIAQALKKKNCGRLFLAISHGIFSKGLESLLQHYERIYTTDSFTDIEHPKLTRLLFNKDF